MRDRKNAPARITLLPDRTVCLSFPFHHQPKHITTARYAVFVVAMLYGAAPAAAQGNNKDVVAASVSSHIFKPAKVEATDERIAQLRLPAGFTVTKFADGLDAPRMIAVAANGDVYVSNRKQGTITLLRRDLQGIARTAVAVRRHKAEDARMRS